MPETIGGEKVMVIDVSPLVGGTYRQARTIVRRATPSGYPRGHAGPAVATPKTTLAKLKNALDAGWARVRTRKPEDLAVRSQAAQLPGHLIPRRHKQMARLSTWMPFAPTGDFAVCTGTIAAPSTARYMTHVMGPRLATVQTTEAARPRMPRP